MCAGLLSVYKSLYATICQPNLPKGNITIQLHTTVAVEFTFWGPAVPQFTLVHALNSPQPPWSASGQFPPTPLNIEIYIRSCPHLQCFFCDVTHTFTHMLIVPHTPPYFQQELGACSAALMLRLGLGPLGSSSLACAALPAYELRRCCLDAEVWHYIAAARIYLVRCCLGAEVLFGC